TVEFEIELRSCLAVIPFGEMFELAPSQQLKSAGTHGRTHENPHHPKDACDRRDRALGRTVNRLGASLAVAARHDANPGKLTVGIPGNGTLGHTTLAWLRRSLGKCGGRRRNLARPTRFELVTSAFGGQVPKFAAGCRGLRPVD